MRKAELVPTGPFNNGAASGVWTLDQAQAFIKQGVWPLVRPVSGSLSGSGTLAIPQGATKVVLTGRGGTGYNDYWYDPGQDYIAPSGYHAAVAAVAGVYAWTGSTVSIVDSGNDPFGYTLAVSTYGTSMVIPPEYQVAPTDTGLYTETNTFVWGSSSSWQVGYYYATSYTVTAPVDYQAAYYDNPGQDYIAPSSGGGPQTGPSTTAALNGSTIYWTGGYDTGGTASTSTQSLTSTGSGQSLTYAIPSGGTLSYSYNY